jgi:hypothetical protein
MKARTSCRGCRNESLALVLDMGEQPPSNALTALPFRQLDQYYPLQLMQCSQCTLLQLAHDVPPDSIFNKTYPLHSSKGSKEWLDHIEGLCGYAWSRFALRHDSQVIEIGSNDGYLLKNFLGSCRVLGIDPTGIDSPVQTIAKPFTAALAEDLPKADLVFAINTVAQIPDLHDFFAGLERVLKLSGTAILEFPDPVTTFGEAQFDTIYHEHYSYLSVTALEAIAAAHGLHIYDVEPQRTHGGSLRVYLGRNQMLLRSVAVQKEREAAINLRTFAAQTHKIRRSFIHFLTTAGFVESRICAYGAAARGASFLNYCFPYAHQIPIKLVADVNPEKIGNYLPGTQLLVASEADLIANEPDYVIILAWTWKNEIVRRLRNLGYTGSFVTAIPTLEIWS